MKSRYNVCPWDVTGAIRRQTSDSLRMRGQGYSWRKLFLLQCIRVFCSSFSWRCKDPFPWAPHSNPLPKLLVSFRPSLGCTFQSGHSTLSYLPASVKPWTKVDSERMNNYLQTHPSVHYVRANKVPALKFQCDNPAFHYWWIWVSWERLCNVQGLALWQNGNARIAFFLWYRPIGIRKSRLYQRINGFIIDLRLGKNQNVRIFGLQVEFKSLLLTCC